ncbi:MAG: NAD-dependent deacylase [Candidatus Latescibacterota bacterium]|nr:MAG: NAD-dependent deacylase [Candidatus Latescibacterota bacterium]
MSDLDKSIDGAVKLLGTARSVVVSTGAGISKESGIPTFRDAPNALWANYDPQTLASPEGFRQDPALVWRWYEDRRRMIGAAKPNPGHFAIAKLQEFFDDFVVITQNIDDLHRKAGSQNIVEVHGNVFRYKCFDMEHPIEELPDDDNVPPKCSCGSLIRPDVVWFGEMLPASALERSFASLERCDTMLVVGTSGIVYPAAGFPAVAKRAGANVIEVNPEATPITMEADVFLKGPAGEVLPVLVERFMETRSE